MTRRTDQIRRRPDGSIDSAFYIARGRRFRASVLTRPLGHARRRPGAPV
jgi:hypothetical protein